MADPTAEHDRDDRGDRDALRDWLLGLVAEHVQLPREDIASHVPLSDYGLDSVYALSVAAEIEDRFGIDVDPTMMWDNPTIDALVEAVSKELAQGT
ncbi:acyl carrier protein [Streptomyces telluris]|uniref:Acyl carrier protein n=1 Tax=Streptomyces telluris TaxID=2720021 RepID=A0A9X2RP73_9ACTN|nr:acyl carrier protein [Streptomyces telluris]MCQ8773593.1 acyl carrier protein [Streptomyces telluris]NJP81954.1 acyl carrier protein [Streptomyces telluris]